jgi:hypothetical protein
MIALRVDVAVDVTWLLTSVLTSGNARIRPPKFLTSQRGSS